jgi:hypothetical protein
VLRTDTFPFIEAADTYHLGAFALIMYHLVALIHKKATLCGWLFCGLNNPEGFDERPENGMAHGTSDPTPKNTPFIRISKSAARVSGAFHSAEISC